MIIEKLKLENFRNYKNREIEIDPSMTLIIGPNGSGKTNLIESLYILSHGRSKRVQKEEELIKLDCLYSRMQGILGNKDKLEVNLSRKEDSTRISKVYKINGVNKTGNKFIGVFKSVLFAPEDIRLVAGSPARRRDYIDSVISQTDYEYRVKLSNYNKVLKQRNKVLERAQGQFLENVYERELSFWNEQLISNAKYLQSARQEFFDYAKVHLKSVSDKLYKKDLILGLEYYKNDIDEEKLSRIRDIEIRTGITQCGPHRDDFGFFLTNGTSLDLKSYGSRGEQRTGVFCVKLLELQYIEERTKEKPVLLLDDIFSELDIEHRTAIYNVLSQHQTIISTADAKMVPENIYGKAFHIMLDA